MSTTESRLNPDDPRSILAGYYNERAVFENNRKDRDLTTKIGDLAKYVWSGTRPEDKTQKVGGIRSLFMGEQQIMEELIKASNEEDHPSKIEAPHQQTSTVQGVINGVSDAVSKIGGWFKKKIPQKVAVGALAASAAVLGLSTDGDRMDTRPHVAAHDAVSAAASSISPVTHTKSVPASTVSAPLISEKVALIPITKPDRSGDVSAPVSPKKNLSKVIGNPAGGRGHSPVIVNNNTLSDAEAEKIKAELEKLIRADNPFEKRSEVTSPVVVSESQKDPNGRLRAYIAATRKKMLEKSGSF